MAMKQRILLSMLAVLLLSACEPSREPPTDAISSEETVRRYWNGKWNDRDPAILDELLTLDHVYVGPASETSSRDEYAQLYETFLNAITDTRLTIDELITADDKVVSRVTVTGIHSGDLPDIPATGNSISVTLTTVFGFEDGKIAEEFETYNELDMLTQLGVTVFASDQGDDEDRTGVERAISRRIDGVNANDLAQLLAVVTEDFEMVPPDAPAAWGSEAADLIRAYLDPYTLSVDQDTDEIVISGDLAVRRYRYELTLTPKDGGEVIVNTGKGINVLRRVADGEWRFTKDFWNEGL